MPQSKATNPVETTRRIARIGNLPLFLMLLAVQPTLMAQFGYTESNGAVSITGYDGSNSVVVIPETINGLPVNAIGGFWRRTSMTSLIIPDTVTTITGTFQECTNLVSIAIPDGATNLLDDMFFGCAGLTTVELPDSIRSIGRSSFYGCISLTNLSIPPGVTSIGSAAFFDCIGLTRVVIPAAVTNIGSNAFLGCTNLVEFLVDPANPAYQSSDGVLFNKDQTELVQFPPGKVGTLQIPNTVTNIRDGALYGWGAVCPGLAAIEVDASNPTFSSLDGVLFNKNQTALLRFPQARAGRYTIPDGVAEIGGGFAESTLLTEVTIPTGPGSIGGWAFRNCISLTNMTIPESVAYIGEAAFEGCSSLKTIAIPANVTSIGWRPFTNCTSLTEINVDPANTRYASMDGMLVELTDSSHGVAVQCPPGKSGRYAIPEGVFAFRPFAVGGCRKLTQVEFPSSGVGLSGYVFTGCTGLLDLVIPGSMSLWSNEFEGCTNLGSVTIQNGLQEVGPAAFRDCTGLTNIIIPASVKSIRGSFYGCSNLTRLTLPEGITNIGVLSFGACTSLTNINIPTSVTQLRGGAFQQCTRLQNLVIPEGIKEIETGLAFECASLTNITIPTTATRINWGAFWGCSSLTRVAIPSGVTNIDQQVFLGCSSLRAIDVDALNPAYSSVDGVLFDKGGTTLVSYPGGKPGRYPIPASVTSFGPMTFRASAGLTSVSLPNSVTRIVDQMFRDCAALTTVTVAGSVTNIGPWAFLRCPNLTGVYFEGHAPTSGCAAFEESTNVTVYYVPGTTGWGPTFDGRPTAPWKPQVLTADASFGVRTNQFGFTIAWANDRTVVVDASPSLTNPAWIPVSTNTVIDGTAYFSDVAWTNHPARFYRVRGS